MYPVECYAGYFVPLKEGKLEVYGFSAVVSDATAASRVTLIDDENLNAGDKHGRFYDTAYDEQRGIIDIKGIANADAVLEQIFPEPLKFRHGVSAVNSSNLVAGSMKLYVR